MAPPLAWDGQPGFADPLSLQFFLRACELGTIGLAASAENIAASAVSKRISELEASLGVALVHRSRRGVEPTAAGLVLLRHARHILQSYQHLRSELQDHVCGVAGKLKVLANISGMSDFVPDAVASFMAAHPQIEVQLEERVSAEIVREIAEGKADLGICREIALSHDVQAHPVRTSQFVALVSRAHPLASQPDVQFSETLRHPQLSITHSSAINGLMVQIARQMGTPLSFRIQVSSFDAAFRVIRSGLALGILPREILGPGLPDGLVALPLRDEWARQRLVICSKRRELLGAAATNLLDHLLAWPVNKDTE